ncbi:MAG TPA: hypothetical protein EYH34_19535 [Planctomycetes bacterium]|nr:hypothetical protein [Planctomycetota bacterium]
MLKTLNALNSLLATLLGFAIVALLGAGGYLGYRALFADKFRLEETQAILAHREAEIEDLSRQLKAKEQQVQLLDDQLASTRQQIDALSRDVRAKQEQIAKLEEDVEAKRRQIEQLEVALNLLKVDRRVAQLDVLDQEGSADEGTLVTTVSFVELGPDGKPLDAPRVFRIDGDVVYVSSLVVKFDDQYVELGDPLRSTSICLFQRIFGEAQEPREGYPLDPVGSQPLPYRTGGKMSDFERQIWERFWEYANDPELAKQVGVRAAHGEAPYQKVVPGKRYRLELRASGGLSFVPMDRPSTADETL